MNMEPKPNYFSIWRTTFHLLRRHAGLLTVATLVIAVPFFILNALANARQIMTLGGASMMGVEVPDEQMRVLWGSMVGADSLASIALSVAIFLVLKYLKDQPAAGFTRHARSELPLLFRKPGFWLFAGIQVLVFAMINAPDGRLKIGGMGLLACSVLRLLSAQDGDAPARRRHLNWSAWLSLALVVLTIPLLYIFFNGYLNAIFLMLADFGAQQILHLLSIDLPSALIPYGVITLSKFLSQWFNLLPMVLLLSTCLALQAENPLRVERVPAAGKQL